jgi:hypothetical protein
LLLGAGSATVTDVRLPLPLVEVKGVHVFVAVGDAEY